MSRNYKDLVEIAENAVSAISDKDLKQVAFQKVLEDLLAVRKDSPAGVTKTINSKVAKPRSKGETRSKSGPTGYVEELIRDGFFASKKSPNDVLSELADRGHHIAPTDARVVLLRLCKGKLLRRKKENKTYLYSNW